MEEREDDEALLRTSRPSGRRTGSAIKAKEGPSLFFRILSTMAWTISGVIGDRT
jgi:hypothetical protein